MRYIGFHSADNRKWKHTQKYKKYNYDHLASGGTVIVILKRIPNERFYCWKSGKGLNWHGTNNLSLWIVFSIILLLFVERKRFNDIFPHYTSSYGIIAYYTRRLKQTALCSRVSMKVWIPTGLQGIVRNRLTESQTEVVTVPSNFSSAKIEKLNAERQSQGFSLLQVMVFAFSNLDPFYR